MQGLTAADAAELAALVEWMDDVLDSDIAPPYRNELAQDWNRLAKVAEEAGEVIDALIGVTAGNARKGAYGTPADVLTELMDVSLTALYAARHWVGGDTDAVFAALLARAREHKTRMAAAVLAR